MKTLQQLGTEAILALGEENARLKETVANLYDLIEAMSEVGQEQKHGQWDVKFL
jgi:hypothetical protein